MKIIAEISSNHCGDRTLAVKMIKAAAEAGADMVKFQSYKAENLQGDWSEADHEWYRQTELSDENHLYFMDVCKKEGIEFLTTCFDRKRIDFLASLGLKHIKIASTDCASYTMLKEIRDAFEFPIVSTGMTYKEEIEKASEILKKGKFALLHCVSLYPTPVEKLNLKKMDWLRNFTPYVGLSDHTTEIKSGVAALSKGASFIEKHFSLDRNAPGKDHKVSILPNQLKELCEFRDFIKKAESKIDFSLSDNELAVREKYVGRWGDNK
ncbi:MAG: N-acetylneuraminate synthase family protein [bacterium]